MYHFELEIVLNFRKHYEKKVQSELIECEKQFKIENNHLTEYGAKKNKVIENFENKMKTGMLIMECGLFLSFIESINTDINKQTKKVAFIQTALKEKKNELIKAIQNRKIIEQLKEKRLKAFLYEENRKQMLILDEFSSNKKCLEMENN